MDISLWQNSRSRGAVGCQEGAEDSCTHLLKVNDRELDSQWASLTIRWLHRSSPQDPQRLCFQLEECDGALTEEISGHQ